MGHGQTPPPVVDKPVTYKALQAILFGGSIAVAMTAIGVVIMVLSYRPSVDEHYQGGLVMAGATVFVLVFVEWALTRRLNQLEIRESVDRLALINSLQAQHKEQLQLLIDNNQATLARAMFQIESVGSEYDHINTMLKSLTLAGSGRTASINALNDKVQRLSEDMTDLLAWRERLSLKLR